MTIFIAADHRGFELKNKLIDYLQSLGYQVKDCGNKIYDPEDDYPDFVKVLIEKLKTPAVEESPDLIGGGKTAAVKKNHDALGIVICGSGVGASIAANRFEGIRSGLGFDKKQVKHAREADHINTLALAADFIDFEKAKEIVDAFVTTKAKKDERYLRRINKIEKLPE